MIQDEHELIVDSPWDCEGLDPFRDDPVQTDNMSFEKDDSEDFVCGLDSNDIQTCPCPAKKNRCAVDHWPAGRRNTNPKVPNTFYF
mgnify:CR=1 FL=1